MATTMPGHVKITKSLIYWGWGGGGGGGGEGCLGAENGYNGGSRTMLMGSIYIYTYPPPPTSSAQKLKKNTISPLRKHPPLWSCQIFKKPSVVFKMRGLAVTLD